MAQRVGNGEQEAVRGRESRSKATGGHEARDDIGHARDFRRGKHDHVVVDGET
jgi:hypothetical protein